MVEPCKLPCGHYFCCGCIKWSFQSKTSCALCRKVPGANFKISVDKQFQEFLKAAYTDEYNIMKAHLVQAGMLNDDIFGVQFVVGNRHELVKNPAKSNSSANTNKHRWTVFFELAHPELKKLTYKLVDKVEFMLHETFRPPKRTVKVDVNKPIEYSTIGWGTFDVPITVFWKKTTGLTSATCEHELSFDGNGKWRTITLMMNRQKVNDVLGLKGDKRL